MECEAVAFFPSESDALELCRCCLASNNKLVSTQNSECGELLETLIGSKVDVGGARVCWGCWRSLRRLAGFRKLCLRAHAVLLQYCERLAQGVDANDFVTQEREKLPVEFDLSFSNTSCIDVAPAESRPYGQSHVNTVSIVNNSDTRDGDPRMITLTFKNEIPSKDSGKDGYTTSKDLTTGLDDEFDFTIVVKSEPRADDYDGVLYETKIGEIKLTEDLEDGDDNDLPVLEGHFTDIELDVKQEGFSDDNIEDIKMEVDLDGDMPLQITRSSHALGRDKRKKKNSESSIRINRLKTKRSIRLSGALRKKRRKDKKEFSCSECGLVFDLAIHLEKHSSMHTGQSSFVCDLCCRSFPLKSVLEKHMQCHTCDRKRFQCDECGKSFIFRKLLYKHKWSHSGEKKPFACSVCSRGFVFENELKTHTLLHTGVRPFSCDKCAKSFTQKAFLKQHLLTHAEGQFYICDVCGRSFSQRAKLSYHRKTHMDVKPFACDLCDRSFVRSGQLKTHKIYHTNERPFICDICGHTFRVKGALTAHKRVHSGERPYRCDICNNSYTEAGYLKKHKRIHTGEKPFSCDICDRAFNETCTLARHKLTHSDERKYACGECGSRFKYVGCLKKHAARKHRQNVVDRKRRRPGIAAKEQQTISFLNF